MMHGGKGPNCVGSVLAGRNDVSCPCTPTAGVESIFLPSSSPTLVYKDKREMITSVSTRDSQRQSNKAEPNHGDLIFNTI